MGAAIGLGGQFDLQDHFLDVIADLVAVDSELNIQGRLGLPLEYLGRRGALGRKILDVLGNRRCLRAGGLGLAIAIGGRDDRVLVGHGKSLRKSGRLTMLEGSRLGHSPLWACD